LTLHFLFEFYLQINEMNILERFMNC